MPAPSMWIRKISLTHATLGGFDKPLGTSETLKSLVQAFLKRQEATEQKNAKVEMLASAGAMLLYIMLLHRLFQTILESDNSING